MESCYYFFVPVDFVEEVVALVVVALVDVPSNVFMNPVLVAAGGTVDVVDSGAVAVPLSSPIGANGLGLPTGCGKSGRLKS